MGFMGRKIGICIVTSLITAMAMNGLGTTILAQSPDVSLQAVSLKADRTESKAASKAPSQNRDQEVEIHAPKGLNPPGKLTEPKGTDEPLCDLGGDRSPKDTASIVPEGAPPQVQSPHQSQIAPFRDTDVQGNQSQLKAVEIRNYTMAELNKMSYADLTALLPKLRWTNVPELFAYNNDTAEFYGDRNRMEALIAALKNAGRDYTKDDSKGIDTLVEVLRSAYYLGYYNRDTLGYINEWEYRKKIIPALIAIEDNPNFEIGTAEQNNVIAAFGRMIGNTAVNAEVINGATKILLQAEQQFDAYNHANGGEFSAVYELLKGINFILNNVLDEQNVPKQPDYIGTFDPFIKAIGKLSLHTNYSPNHQWFLYNAIYYSGLFSKFSSNPSSVNEILTRDMEIFPQYSYAYMQSASSINQIFNGMNSKGIAIHYDQLVNEAKHFYFPKRYTFDDGQMIMYTGKDVTDDKIERLYWASKEVRAQFYRISGSDVPLEQGHPDDILSIYIYNNMEEYKINLLLNGLETQNGGIYIESQGTFYTWERTSSESVYTLEELFRHEFTHFLQSRYLIPGFWGESEIYRNDRVTWMEEGGAELLAGSSRENGILPRRSMSQGYLNDPVASWMNANEIVHAKFNGFRFYTFAYQLQYYLYEKRPDVLENIANLVRGNDGTGYDAYMNVLGHDEQLNKNYIDSAIDLHQRADAGQLTIPLVAEDYLLRHPVRPRSTVLNDIHQAVNLTDIRTEEHSSELLNTFVVRGTYTGGISKGIIEDRKAMDEIVDHSLKALDHLPWSGYKTFTGYFVNHRLDQNNHFVFDVVFHGVLPDDASNPTLPPVVDIHGPYEGTAGYALQFNSEGTFSHNGTITNYEWNFGDGTTSSLPNPTHVYKKMGTYNISLKVTDSNGVTEEQTTTAVIHSLDKEIKPNNRIELANGPLPFDVDFPATMDQSDTASYFYFELENAGKVHLVVTQPNGMDLTWVLYKESDLQNYWQDSRRNGNLQENTFDAPAGKYYLLVYKNSNTPSNVGAYNIKVSVDEASPVEMQNN
ncbi:collagenase [Paenibacillus albilobatus]|nr:collagenase [Paenibacillus albilobatus]